MRFIASEHTPEEIAAELVQRTVKERGFKALLLAERINATRSEVLSAISELDLVDDFEIRDTCAIYKKSGSILKFGNDRGINRLIRGEHFNVVWSLHWPKDRDILLIRHHLERKRGVLWIGYKEERFEY